jgi:hypothetical protein
VKIIAAQPGFWSLTMADDLEDPPSRATWREPVIAWNIEWFEDEHNPPGELRFVVRPITTEGCPFKEPYSALLAPDGRVYGADQIGPEFGNETTWAARLWEWILRDREEEPAA